MKTFFVVWIGQLISIVGSSLTGFALSIWVYQQSGSVTLLALVMLAATVPGIIIAPFAGALVDRWDRRLTMMGGDGAAGIATGVVALLLFIGDLNVAWVFPLVIVGSIGNSFQEPAWTASIPMLVPKQHLGRANGLAQTGQAVGNLLAPAIAGALLVTVGLKAVLLIDFVTFLFAVSTVALVRIPSPKRAAAPAPLRSEAGDGWRFVKERPGLLGLLVVMAILNFEFGFANVLFIPLFLSFTNEFVFGSAMSIAGVGMLIGTVVMSTWGGPKKRVRGLASLLSVAGLATCLVGLRPAVLPAAAGMFGLMLLIPIINGTSTTLWQMKVDLDMQGRVFALRRMMAMVATPVSYLLAGPLADRVFEPLMSGSLADTIGKVIGVGEGRGIGLLFIVMGILLTLTMAVAYAIPRIRDVEIELPDAVGDVIPAVPTS
jgi:DHA3 family macrolide efflux protein-like MFS transporter